MGTTLSPKLCTLWKGRFDKEQNSSLFQKEQKQKVKTATTTDDCQETMEDDETYFPNPASYT